MCCLQSHYSVKLLTSRWFEQPCHVVRHNAPGCGLGAERHDLSAAQHLPHNYPLSSPPLVPLRLDFLLSTFEQAVSAPALAENDVPCLHAAGQLT